MENTQNPNLVKFVGYVHQVGARKEFDSGFSVRDIVLVEDPSAKYPQYAVLTAKRSANSQARTDYTTMPLAVGTKVEAVYIPDGREWNGRWFGGLRLVKLSVLENVASSAPAPSPADPSEMDAVEDDLPF